MFLFIYRTHTSRHFCCRTEEKLVYFYLHLASSYLKTKRLHMRIFWCLFPKLPRKFFPTFFVMFLKILELFNYRPHMTVNSKLRSLRSVIRIGSIKNNTNGSEIIKTVIQLLLWYYIIKSKNDYKLYNHFMLRKLC